MSNLGPEISQRYSEQQHRAAEQVERQRQWGRELADQCSGYWSVSQERLALLSRFQHLIPASNLMAHLLVRSDDEDYSRKSHVYRFKPTRVAAMPEADAEGRTHFFAYPAVATGDGEGISLIPGGESNEENWIRTTKAKKLPRRFKGINDQDIEAFGFMMAAGLEDGTNPLPVEGIAISGLTLVRKNLYREGVYSASGEVIAPFRSNGSMWGEHEREIQDNARMLKTITEVEALSQ